MYSADEHGCSCSQAFAWHADQCRGWYIPGTNLATLVIVMSASNDGRSNAHTEKQAHDVQSHFQANLFRSDFDSE